MTGRNAALLRRDTLYFLQDMVAHERVGAALRTGLQANDLNGSVYSQALAISWFVCCNDHMKIDHVSIATATLLTQLILALEKGGALKPTEIDAVIRESISLNGEEADNAANLGATRFLQDVWATVRDARG